MMKGQFIAVTTIFTLLFITGSTVFGSLIITDEFERELEMNSGDMNQISAAKLKATRYEDRMGEEMQFSADIAALNLADQTRNWGENSISSLNDLRNEYTSEFEEEIRSQNRMIRCQQPQIDGININYERSPLLNRLTLNTEITLDEEWITCSSDSTVVKVSLNTQELTASNPSNRYLTLARNATNLAQYIEGQFPDEEWTGTDREVIECQDSVTDEEVQQANNDAREDSKEDAIQDDNFAETLLVQFTANNNFADGIEVDHETDFDASYETSGGKQECTYYEASCPDDERRNREECEPVAYDGENYSVEYESTIPEAETSYSLTDNNNQVMDSTGEEQNLEFSFGYTESIG